MAPENPVDVFSFGLLELSSPPGSPFMVGMKLIITGFFDMFFLL